MSSGRKALIQGASRGIGLQFCKHLLQDSRNLVVATCRSIKSTTSEELLLLREKFPKTLVLYELDVLDEKQIQRTAEAMQKNHDGTLDLLVNTAGMLHPSGKGETSLRDVSLDGLSVTIQTNALGPLLMAKYFAPFLQRGGGGFGTLQGNSHKGVIANISARVGSITDNKLGGWYSYRMSKSALNMATKTLSIELGRGRHKVVCVSIHPGTVDTDLSRRYHKNIDSTKIFSPEYSVKSMMNIINRISFEDSGKFFAWDGKEILW